MKPTTDLVEIHARRLMADGYERAAAIGLSHTTWSDYHARGVISQAPKPLTHYLTSPNVSPETPTMSTDLPRYIPGENILDLRDRLMAQDPALDTQEATDKAFALRDAWRSRSERPTATASDTSRHLADTAGLVKYIPGENMLDLRDRFLSSDPKINIEDATDRAFALRDAARSAGVR